MRLVFDSASWSKVGDVGDNSIFWKKATMLRLYRAYDELLCDVMFEDGRISNGHFYHATRPIEEE